MEIFKNRQTSQEHTILSWKKVDQQANSSSTLLISCSNILISEEYASTKVCFYVVMKLMLLTDFLNIIHLLIFISM